MRLENFQQRHAIRLVPGKLRTRGISLRVHFATQSTDVPFFTRRKTVRERFLFLFDVRERKGRGSLFLMARAIVNRGAGHGEETFSRPDLPCSITGRRGAVTPSEANAVMDLQLANLPLSRRARTTRPRRSIYFRHVFCQFPLLLPLSFPRHCPTVHLMPLPEIPWLRPPCNCSDRKGARRNYV